MIGIIEIELNEHEKTLYLLFKFGDEIIGGLMMNLSITLWIEEDGRKYPSGVSYRVIYKEGEEELEE